MMMGVKRVLGFIASLFDFMGADASLRNELPKANLRAGIRNFLIGIFLFLLSSFALAALSVVYLMLVYDATSAASLVVTAKPAITPGFIASSLLYFGVIMLPFLFVGSFLHQGIVYLLMRALGGRGSYQQQYFMSSYVTLALGLASLGMPVALAIGIVLPCALLFFALTYIVGAAYLALFVQAKILVAVHKVSFGPALAVALLAALGSLAAYGLLQLAVASYGLGPDFTATFGMAGMNASVLNMSVTGLPNLSGIQGLPGMNASQAGAAANTSPINTTG